MFSTEVKCLWFFNSINLLPKVVKVRIAARSLCRKVEEAEAVADALPAGRVVLARERVHKAGGQAPETAVARFDVRYKLALGGESRPLSLNVVAPSDGTASSANFNFAAGIAAYGLTLRNSQYKGLASFSMAYDLVNGARVSDVFGYRARLAELIKLASELQ